MRASTRFGCGLLDSFAVRMRADDDRSRDFSPRLRNRRQVRSRMLTYLCCHSLQLPVAGERLRPVAGATPTATQWKNNARRANDRFSSRTSPTDNWRATDH